MKQFIVGIIWLGANILGGGLVATNLLQVGTLGLALAGMLVILLAWVWLVNVVITLARTSAHVFTAERSECRI